MTNVIGPDVSFYQDDPITPTGIHFEKMRAAAEFVIIRAGQNVWADPDFKFNWRESKKAGLRRGCYWFYDSRAHPVRQAETWYALLEGDLGELPLFADFEEKYKGRYSGWGKWYDFLEKLKQLVGLKEIGIYTAYYYWRDHAPNPITQIRYLDYFHQYPLWIAHYKTPKPNVPKPWKVDEWLFWQFTEAGSGLPYGVESHAVDLNYFHGDHDEFMQRFPNGPTGIPPRPLPQPGRGTKHRVMADSLRVREGPGTTFDILGKLERDEIVQEIAANPERTWINIKSAEGLVGWVSNDYLIVEEIPNEVPDAPLPTPPALPTGRQYLAKTELKLREGPGATYHTIDILDAGEIVQEVGSTSDRSWLRVKRTNGGLGWVMSAYLTSVQDGLPAQQPAPAPLNSDWYQITASALTVRDAPAASGKSIGFFQKDDILPSLELSEDGGWIKLRRVDGTIGWVHGKYVKNLGKTQPTLVKQNLFKGVHYLRKELETPLKNVAHCLLFDLKAAPFTFLVTPPSTPSGIICTRTVSEFLVEHGMDFAINGNGFSYIDPPPKVLTCTEGDPVTLNGFAASRGRVYSERGGPTLYINRNHTISINRPLGNIYNAISGDRIVVEKGKMVPNLAANIPNPRTAIGLSANGRTLILVVVDGRQPGFSEGVNFHELADLLISLSAFSGMNMDGGGSSAMVIRSVDGKPRVLNSPIDADVPGKESSVANHLGIRIRN